MVLSTVDNGGETRNIPRPSKNKRSRKPNFIAGLTATTLGIASSAFFVTPAYADPGYSQATAQYLSGSLLDLSLDDIAELEGVSAQALFGDDATDVQTRDLGLNVLGDTITLIADNGVQIPLDVADAGIIGQYASASPSGDSTAVSGLITDDGTVGIAPDSTNPPGPLQLNLTDLLSVDIADQVTNFTLTTGVNTASATQDEAGVSSGDYSIAGLEATLTSPLFTTVASEISAATTELETTVNGVLGPDGQLVDDLTGLVSSVGVAEANGNLTLNLNEPVDTVLSENQILGAEGPVTINLATGVVTIDIAELYTANGININELDPETNILGPQLIDFVATEVDELIDALLDEVNETVTAALNAASLDLEVTVPGETTPLVTINIEGTLEDIAAGTGTSEIVLGDDVTLDISLLTGAVNAAVTSVLNDAIDVTDLTGSLSTLDLAIATVLGDVVALDANVQETSASGAFTQTALRLGVLNTTDEFGELLSLNLAQASVGPNGLGSAADDTSISGFTPVQGPEAGGTVVTITGEGFAGADGVNFGTIPATDFEVVSDTEIVATSPAGTGAVTLTVTGTEFGDAVSEGSFTYIPDGAEEPAGSASISPTTGPETGGTVVVIEGENLGNTETVLFGETPGTNLNIVSDEVVVVTSPAGTGTVPVTLVDGADVEIVADEEFTYVAGPTEPGDNAILDIAPNSGPEAGGTEVAIVGEGFTGTTEVLFGTTPATSFVVVSDNLITTVSPAGEGEVPVSVTTPEGTLVSTELFEYIPETVIDSFFPTQGPEAGGTQVTIIGEGFTGTDEVLFGTTPATDFEVISDIEIVATSPAGTGSVPITIVTESGDTVTSEASFEYVAPEGNGEGTTPAIDSITPSTGPETGGTIVIIIGEGFTGTDEVLFGETPAADFEVISDTEIRATSPAGTGNVDITVVTPNGAVESPEPFVYVNTGNGGSGGNGVDDGNGVTDGSGNGNGNGSGAGNTDGNGNGNNDGRDSRGSLASTGGDISSLNTLTIAGLMLIAGGLVTALSRRFLSRG